MNGGTDTPENKGLLLKLKHAFRLNISSKILIYFLGIALIPLIVVSYVLVTNANDQLLRNASANQQAVAVDLSQRVDNYLANNLNQLSLIARLYSSGNFADSNLDKSVAALFGQNATLRQVTLLSANGNERTFVNDSNGVSIKNNNTDVNTSEALKFLADKPYFIGTGRDENNKPQINIGIPILKKYEPAKNGLFALQTGKADEIIGGIAGYYDVSDLWDSVLSTKIGTSNMGYAYVVDNTGTLVTHPDKKFLRSHRDLKDTQAVRLFLLGDTKTQRTISEVSKEVISTPHKTETDWAVIVEEPVSSIYASINSYIQMAATIGISAIVLSILAGLFFSRQLIRPIQALAQGAKRMERGDFDQTIDVKTKDEFQELAETFNGMAKSIKKLVGDMKTNNMRLKFEQIKLNNIISSVSDGVVAVNAKGEIVSVNPPAAAMIEQDPKTLEGKKMSTQFRLEHDGTPFMPDLNNGGIYRYTDLTLTRSDAVVYLDIMVAVLDHQDSDVAAIITIHDQTASRELSFMKLDFVAIAAHELRTPLTVVRGYLDMLNSDAKSNLSIYNLENLQKAIVGANQLRELINKLLNIARIERGDMEIFLEKLNLTKLVRENVEQHVSAAQQKEQKITYSSNTESTVYVPADSASILEVVNNLVGNAIKYTGKGGHIEVRLETDKDTVRISVADDGPGVPEELRDRLFTKFYRAERSLIAGTRGTGLGLFISKTIIELQHGTIGIEPDSGKGSVFYFTLPIYNPDRDDELIAKKTTGGIRGWFKNSSRR